MSRFDFARKEPYSPDEFLDLLREEALHANARIDHPYVQFLVDGKLSLEQLRDYAKQDYQLKKCPSWWLAGRILNSPTIEDQKLIARTFIEEMGGVDPRFTGHQSMYLAFGRALGLSDNDLECADLLPSTVLAVDMLMHINRHRSVVEALASGSVLGEQTNVRVAKLLAPAFRRHYQIPDEGLVWFLEHVEADEGHGALGESIVKKYATTKDMQNKIWDCIIRTKSAWWVFFDGLYSATFGGVALPRYRVGRDLPVNYPMEAFQ
jgi:pyrroloquinoline quinone (PQQ) biosynthesis protein C